MASYPKYRITKCCNAPAESAIFAIQNFGLLTIPGTHVYTGADVTINGVIFENGYCYVIEEASPPEFPGPADLDGADFTHVPAGCDDTVSVGGPCADCSTSFKKLVFTPCCEQFDTLEFQGINWQDYLGVIIPLPGIQDASHLAINYHLQVNQCYEVTVVDVTQAEFDSLNLLPPYVEGTNFQQVTDSTSGLDCTSAAVIEQCPCPSFCYIAYNCDGGYIEVLSDLNQYGTADISNYVGQYVTLIDNDAGTPIAGTYFIAENPSACRNGVLTISVDPVLPTPCDCRCFEITGVYSGITYVDCNGQIIFDKSGPPKICSTIYPIVGSAPGTPLPVITEGGNCVDSVCPIECFILVNCDTGEILTTEGELYDYYLTNQVVTLDGYEGCWRVLSDDCLCIDVVVDGVTLVATFNGQIYNNEKVWELEVPQNSGGGAPLVTYYIWADVFPGSWNITQEVGVSLVSTRLAYISSGILDCPILASWGTGRWPDSTPVGTASSTKSATCTIGCDDCPTNVTVLTTFDDCPSCIGPIAYKLTSCDNSSDIIYTTTDLSAYVDEAVEIDCGCYLVELITYNPPTDVAVTVDYTFEDCPSCKAIYYQLTDCTDGTNIVYTTVDLSAYVNHVIKIQSCDTCWTVTETREPGTIETVVFLESFDVDGCLPCGYDLPCICSKITNVSETLQSISYINCDDATVVLLLEAGESSDKVCLKYWNIPAVADGDPPLLYPEYFGNCMEGQCPQPHFPNNRTVKPGYNTPICTADKYDRITCNFADVMYKDALEKRYGISNCCPEEDQKWILSKSLIDIQALRDPCYTCDTVTNCSCGNTSICTTCNCKN